MTTTGIGTPVQSMGAQQQALYETMNGQTVANQIGAPAAAGGDDGSSPPVYLTPEALLAYCQSRLQNIDTQVQTVMAQQQNADWEQSAIGGILTEVAKDTAAANGGVLNNAQDCQALEQKLEDLITQIQAKDPGCSQLSQLETLHDTVMATGSGPYTDALGSHSYYYGGDPMGLPTQNDPPPGVNQSKDNGLGSDELGDFKDTLTSINGNLNQDGQINMIRVESLISQQTTAITLTTSILQSLNDGYQKIADKIGT